MREKEAQKAARAAGKKEVGVQLFEVVAEEGEKGGTMIGRGFLGVWKELEASLCIQAIVEEV